jgi:hypothetical protein
MKKAISIILIVVILGGLYFFFLQSTPIENNNSSAVNEEGSILLIETKEEAISRAEAVSIGLTEFMKTNQDFGTILSSAWFSEVKYFEHFDFWPEDSQKKLLEEDNYWLVSFWPENSIDYWYNIYLSSDGEIIYEGVEAGG